MHWLSRLIPLEVTSLHLGGFPLQGHPVPHQARAPHRGGPRTPGATPRLTHEVRTLLGCGTEMLGKEKDEGLSQCLTGSLMPLLGVSGP